MKRLFLVLLAPALVALSLTGCSSPENAGATNEVESNATSPEGGGGSGSRSAGSGTR